MTKRAIILLSSSGVGITTTSVAVPLAVIYSNKELKSPVIATTVPTQGTEKASLNEDIEEIRRKPKEQWSERNKVVYANVNQQKIEEEFQRLWGPKNNRIPNWRETDPSCGFFLNSIAMKLAYCSS
ncbi:hypothetical protein MHLP_04255 [Candidatus Mycoplasma haematolamae str. Purdue]|uniref:Uncharacterized protein n=1 Tax=Mycoplasma haematolamae (strain Purdue) TaxID=1212765 RepID=I7CGR8_MYCHA|nr:hypothetical protein [Candidatus Mycoplasma haematolamae]AFO52431.1 hypothetical protein MHLP_04255 [Candidatus Mycoplasma haematolamae str. Purdue]